MAFWADTIADEIQTRYRETTDGGESIIFRDEKTASGRVHVGSLVSTGIHAVVSEILTERGIPNTFYFEINDTDPMDGLPADLDTKQYGQYMGQPLYTIPAPDGTAKNFAEYYGDEYVGTMHDLGFSLETYLTSELYLTGKMNPLIRTALERAADIRRIYKEVSGSIKDDEWYPLNVVCESCGKVGTTKVTDFDGELVTYTCVPDMVTWAAGCAHTGRISPFDGRASFPWKVEWAAKFKVMGVQFEAAGKDHYTKGGARHVANQIAEEVFEYPAPYGVPHEFFLVGGKKMSSSKGSGSSAREIANLIPPHILRLALFGRNVNRQVNFDPQGDTIPHLYDEYDKYARLYWSGIEDDFTRMWVLIHTPEQRAHLTERFLPRFSQVVFLMQMPHINIEEEVARMKGTALSNADKKELEERMFYAGQWLKLYAPEQFKFELQEESVPEAAQNLTDEQKGALREVVQYIEQTDELDGQELHTKLHEIRKETGIEAKEFFSGIYLSFLGKDHGPKAGWFLSVLNREFLIQRLQIVST